MSRRVIRAERDVTMEGKAVKSGDQIAELTDHGGVRLISVPPGAPYNASNVQSMINVKWAAEYVVPDGSKTKRAAGGRSTRPNK